MRTSIGGLVLVFLIVFASACASLEGSEGADRDSSRITAEELSTMQADHLLEVVQLLRPRWLRMRGSRSIRSGTEIVVFRDRARLGGIDELRSIPVRSAAWLEYMDAAAATSMLPGVQRGAHIDGAIIVHTSGTGDG